MPRRLHGPHGKQDPLCKIILAFIEVEARKIGRVPPRSVDLAARNVTRLAMPYRGRQPDSTVKSQKSAALTEIFPNSTDREQKSDSTRCDASFGGIQFGYTHRYLTCDASDDKEIVPAWSRNRLVTFESSEEESEVQENQTTHRQAL